MNALPTSRRNFLKLALAGGGALTMPGLLSACAGSTTTSGGGGSTSGSFQLPKDINANWPEITSTEVVLAGFGGETYQTRHQLIFDPFTEISGATVVDAPWDYGKFLNMVDAPSPEWDAIDFDRAFAKLDELKQDLVFYDSYAQGQQLMVQGSASMMATANSRMIQLQKQGRGDFTYEQAVLYPWGAFPITQNAPHADAMNALIDTMSHAAVQAEIARTLFLGPIVSEAFDMLDDDELALQPNSEENRAKAAVLNTEVAAEQDAEYVERFFAWVGQ